MAVKPIPDGSHTITPYLLVPRVADLIAFLKEAFDAREVHRMLRPGGRLMHAEVRIGHSAVMMGEPTSTPSARSKAVDRPRTAPVEQV